MIYGIGINDARYPVYAGSGKERVICPFYERWREMLKRCYSNTEKYHSYKDCRVHPDWHYFMNFRAWMMLQDWRGKQLDKDIIIPGNRIYSTETCCFVSYEINLLVSEHGTTNKTGFVGVFKCRKTGKFLARCKVRRKNHKHIGTFETAQEASQAYRSYKAEQILKISREGHDPMVIEGLMKRAATLLLPAPQIGG